MYKSFVILLTIAASIRSAEISSSYALLEKQASFNPDIKTEPVMTHPIFKKETNEEAHPVFRAEDYQARRELVKSDGAVKHDMLADQPQQRATSPDVMADRVNNPPMPNNVGIPVEVAYPEVPYAPGYGYGQGYAGAGIYDPYSSELTNYFLEPDTSAFSMLWSQVPDARAIAGFVGRSIAWMINSMFVILIGSFVTVGVCSYTDLCTITFHGVGPIREEMRALMTPERLENISTAADFVKTAIDKYQKIQKVTDGKHFQRQGL